ncbi:HMR1 protein, partial [Formicarius rufipectus]|nr:HMR1 protein [Formicarius rufipectus]
SLRCQHVAVSQPGPGVPQYMAVGSVDRIPISRYDSERGRMEPLTAWMEKGLEPGYWDELTRVSEQSQLVDVTFLETL